MSSPGTRAVDTLASVIREATDAPRKWSNSAAAAAHDSHRCEYERQLRAARERIAELEAEVGRLRLRFRLDVLKPAKLDPRTDSMHAEIASDRIGSRDVKVPRW